MKIMLSADNRGIVTDIFRTALRPVQPYDLVRRYAGEIRDLFQKKKYVRLLSAGFGKASCPMALALEDSISDIIDSGVAITKYGHCKGHDLNKFRVHEAGHPLPDESGLKGTREVINLLKGADEHTLVICLISGGGSALLVSPYEGISLADKQAMTDLLLKAGATIRELNTVRKHLSAVKGGRLAEIAYPARVISLIISDVIGDRLDVIASGPTSPDVTTYHEALKVIEKYGLNDKSPGPVIELLKKGADGFAPETPKDDSRIFEKVANLIIANNGRALQAAKDRAEALGFEAHIASAELAGEARDAAKWLAGKVFEIKNARRSKRPYCLVTGGETTVNVRGNGLGGRNMEMALSFAVEIDGIKGVTFLSGATDGTDGPTDAAGAVVDGQTVSHAMSLGIDPQHCLENNDSFHFFQTTGDLLITGPTGTNVMDIQVIIIQ